MYYIKSQENSISKKGIEIHNYLYDLLMISYIFLIKSQKNRFLLNHKETNIYHNGV